MLERPGDLGDESLGHDDGLGHEVAETGNGQAKKALSLLGFSGPLGELAEGGLDVSGVAHELELLEESALLDDDLLGDSDDPVVGDVPELDILLRGLLGETRVHVADLAKAGSGGPQSDGGVDRALRDEVGPSGHHEEEDQLVPLGEVLLGHEETATDRLVLGWHKVGRGVEQVVKPLPVQLPELLGFELPHDATKTLELGLLRLLNLVRVDLRGDDRNKPGMLLEDRPQGVRVQSGHCHVKQSAKVAHSLFVQVLDKTVHVEVDLAHREHIVLGGRKVPRETRPVILVESCALGLEVKSERVGEVVEGEGVAGSEEKAPQVPRAIRELLENSLGTDNLLVLEVRGSPPQDVHVTTLLPKQGPLEEPSRMLREASTAAAEIATGLQDVLNGRQVGVVLLEEAIKVKGWDDKTVGRTGIGLHHVRRMRGQSAFLVPGAGWLGFYTLRRLTCAISGKVGGSSPARVTSEKGDGSSPDRDHPTRPVTREGGVTFLTARAPRAAGVRVRWPAGLEPESTARKFTRNRSAGSINSARSREESPKRTLCHAMDPDMDSRQESVLLLGGWWG